MRANIPNQAGQASGKEYLNSNIYAGENQGRGDLRTTAAVDDG